MRRSISVTIASLCLLAVWLSTPVLAVAHVVVAEHRFCAEHERLEEGTEGHASGSEQERVVESDATSISPDRTPESSEEHEGCAFGDSFTLEDGFTVPSDFAIDATSVWLETSVLPTTVATRTLALLRIAPKNSPPSLC